MTSTTTSATSSAPNAEREKSTVTETLDRLSLAQALRDVEVANARVIDLTARLTESNAEVKQLRDQVAALASLPPQAPPIGQRALVVGPIKAIGRRTLPLGVRIRIRSMLR